MQPRDTVRFPTYDHERHARMGRTAPGRSLGHSHHRILFAHPRISGQPGRRPATRPRARLGARDDATGSASGG